MNYIGSKRKLASFLKDEIINAVGSDLSQKVFCDIFAGTGIVGRTFKPHVKQVISNDLEHYSFVLNKNYIENHKAIADKEKYIEELNSLPLIEDGFIYQNYCMGSGSERQYFSDENGKKIDTMRTKIREWKKSDAIDESLYYFLLASLVESADKIANTASVYGAFLKHIKKSALKELVLEPAHFLEKGNSHVVFNCDSNELIKEIKGDILYLDPPYNQRQYSANYHMLNTITQYDDFVPKGKTGLREYNRSDYSKKNEVHASFEELIKNANFQYIFLSYNNEGLMSEEDVKNIMSKYGRYDLQTKEYQRFKSRPELKFSTSEGLNPESYKTENRNHTANMTYEYLHILEKR